MPIKSLLCVLLLVSLTNSLCSQPGMVVLAQDEHYALGDVGEDPSPDLSAYEQLNEALGGDSVRICAGHPCIGWVEDNYENGNLKHRGYYDDGKLAQYRNYHHNGNIEREFKVIDAIKSIQRTYHANGLLRSETRYISGASITYEDHYVDGTLRYSEERHRKEPYFVRMDLYDADGNPISLLALVDKKRVEFELQEFHPGGILKAKGRARYDPARMDTQRIGTWVYFDKAGSVSKEEDYMDGRVATAR